MPMARYQPLLAKSMDQVEKQWVRHGEPANQPYRYLLNAFGGERGERPIPTRPPTPAPLAGHGADYSSHQHPLIGQRPRQ